MGAEKPVNQVSMSITPATRHEGAMRASRVPRQTRETCNPKTIAPGTAGPFKGLFYYFLSKYNLLSKKKGSCYKHAGQNVVVLVQLCPVRYEV